MNALAVYFPVFLCRVAYSVGDTEGNGVLPFAQVACVDGEGGSLSVVLGDVPLAVDEAVV